MDPSGITGKYPVCCWNFNSDPVIIRYRDVFMTMPSKILPPPPSSLWMDPTIFLSFKLYSWMSWYVGSPSTLIRRGIKK